MCLLSKSFEFALFFCQQKPESRCSETPAACSSVSHSGGFSPEKGTRGAAGPPSWKHECPERWGMGGEGGKWTLSWCLSSGQMARPHVITAGAEHPLLPRAPRATPTPPPPPTPCASSGVRPLRERKSPRNAQSSQPHRRPKSSCFRCRRTQPQPPKALLPLVLSPLSPSAHDLLLTSEHTSK